MYEIIRLCHVHMFAPGHVLFRQREHGESAFIIESGQIEITVESEGLREVIATLGPSEVLGELSLIDPGARSATAVVVEAVVLYELRGPEFQKLVEGVAAGLTLAQALDKMYERMPTPELKFFSIVIAIQQKTGGNLAEALNNLSIVLRARKMMGEKIKALSSEATASAGIIGSLPPAVMILVSLTTPAYMAKLFTDPRGQFMLLIAVAMMAFGVFVMKKMIAFKF
jgi:CRP-like cAMP-binding protein